MRVLIFACFCAAAVAANPTVNCSDGPIVWCATVKAAKACNALDHCIQTVWGTHLYPKDSDIACSTCEEFVTDVRQYIAKGETKTVEEILVERCHKLPAAISAECAAMAHNVSAEIVKLINSNLEPLPVCTAMRLCNNKKIDKILQSPAAGVVDSNPETEKNTEIFFNECDDCMLKMGQVTHGFKTMRDDDLTDRMLMVCGELGSYSTACSGFVMGNFPKIKTWLDSRMKPVELCRLSNKCMQPNLEKPSDMKEEDACTVCTDTLQGWRSILLLNSTEEDFKELMLDVCTEVGFLIDQCRDVVDQYYVQVYDWLMHEFQPSGICKAIGFCNGLSLVEANVWPVIPVMDAELSPPAAMVNLQPQIYDRGGMVKDGPPEEDAVWFKNMPDAVKNPLKKVDVEINPLSGSTGVSQLSIDEPVYVAGAESCAICQTVLHEIEIKLTDGQTEEEIKQIVDNICVRLPSGIDQECRGFVERYGSYLIALLAQKFDPATVCPKMNLCPEGIDIQIVSLAGGEFPKSVSYDVEQLQSPSVACEFCEYAINELQQALGENSTQEEIREALIGLCDRLPQSVAGECELLVDAYSEELIDSVLLKLTPEQTCRYLMICKPADVVPPPRALPQRTHRDQQQSPIKKKDLKVAATPGCILCEFIMRELDDMLKKNATEADIEASLKKVCSLMPKSIRADCDSFVNQYIEAIIETLEHVPPHEACSVIALCATRKEQNKNNFKIRKGEMKCLMCKDLMQLLKKVLLDDKIDKKIGDDFEKLCKYLPKGIGKKYKGQCHDLMENYGPYIVNMIATLKKPEELCSYIDMCDPIPGLVKIDPSVEKCQLGPKYFCAKKNRAVVCDKVKLCMETIWDKEGKNMKKSKH